MSESFDLTVHYNGKDYEVEARFVRLGYIHQFHINIDGNTLIIEFDEERSYRVIDPSGKALIETGMIEAVVEKISSLH